MLFILHFIQFTKEISRIIIEKYLVSSKEDQLLVITIPGCPFCLASIQTIKKIKERIPTLNVKYILCSSDSLTINSYSREINGAFPISITQNPKVWAKICQGKFPSFLLITKNQSIIWSNENFGTLAKDAIEHKFEFMD